jgi:acyl-CoA reductase-like NAD-dependent aldehyde dehydrogenase
MSARSLVDLLYEAGLPEAYCQFVLTDNELTGNLIEDPRVQYLTFIGSFTVTRVSARAALATAPTT